MSTRKLATTAIFAASFFMLVGMTQGPCAFAGMKAEEVTTSIIDKECIESIYKDFIYAHVPWPKEDVVISGIRTGDDISLPGRKFTFEVMPPANGSYIGDVTLRVVFRVDGREARRTRISGHIDVYDNVACTVRPMRRHDIIQKDDLCVVRRIISRTGGAPLHDVGEVVGKRLVSSLRAGEILKKDMMEPTPVIKRGDRVTIVAETENFLITAWGKAMEAGIEGEMIRVCNSKSKKDIYARVVDASTVKVDL